MTLRELPKLQFYRGNSDSLTLQFFDSDGVTPISLTGTTVYLTVKSKADYDLLDTKGLVLKTITQFSNTGSGICAIPITSTDTSSPYGDYKYDVKYATSTVDVTVGVGDWIIEEVETNRG